MPGPLDPSLADALAALASGQAHDQTLAELEGRADALGLPMVDRATGSFVALVLRAVGARRVVELGAGHGDLTWWLAGATGADREVLVVTDPDETDGIEVALRRGGRFAGVRLRGASHPAPASPDHLAEVAGPLDAVVVRDVTARLVEVVGEVGARLRDGGVLLVEGVLADGAPAGRAAAVVRDALEDPELWASVVPLGRGWLVALRARSDLGGAATDQLW
ncbi:hypothetical protein FTX61_14505 [Nitriliruptoraceae bacterium ZYF776]|nr:hypothetical protein [Profundirhabdus halotolerans]